MITVYVKVTFYYTDGIHQAGTICQVREEDFDARFMKKLESPYENIYSKSEVDALLLEKQDTLIEGTGIDIDEDNEISCTVEPSSVTVTQVQSTGTKIATIDVDGVDTDLYAPEGGSGGLDEDVIADEFDTTPTVTPNVYNQNDFCTYNNYVWVCLKNNVTSEPAWGSSDWQQAGTSVITSFPAWVDQNAVFKSGTTYYQNTGAGVFAQSASDITSKQQVTDRGAWSSSTSTYHQYSAGDFCMHEGGLYKCTGSTTGESWVAAKWSATQVTDELGGGGSGSGATVIEVWDDGESGPTPPHAPALADSLALVQSYHAYCYFKVNGTNKNLTEVKALLEAGYCVLKTSTEIATVLACDSGHNMVFAQSYGQDLPTNYVFNYSSGSSKWSAM